MDGKLNAEVRPDGTFGLPFDEVRISADKAVDLSNVQIVFCRGGVDMVTCATPTVCLSAGGTLSVSGLHGTLDVRLG